MSQATMPTTSMPSPGTRRSAANLRYFHVGASATFLLIMILGFQQFYVHGRAYPGRPLAPPIRALLIAHGVAMSAWVILLLVQSLLIANRKHRIHMTLGKIGAVLAGCIFLLGLRVGVSAAQVAPPQVRLWNLPYKQFMAVPIISVIIFAGFVTLGVWYRKRAEVHRSMMLLATLAAIPAAADRIGWLHDSYLNTIWGTIFGPFFSSLVLGGIFLLIKWAMTQRFDRYYALGWGFLILSSAGIMQLATSGLWDRIANFLLSY